MSDTGYQWCRRCAKAYADATLGEGGRCPGCGRVLLGRRRIPWHMWLMIVATAVYLGWRLVQLGGWLAHHV